MAYEWSLMKDKWLEWLKDSDFKYKEIKISEKRSHYHFKKRKDMKLAMLYNWNSWDTFSYGNSTVKIPSKEDLLNTPLTSLP
jgi:hypothetical protein